MKKKIFLILSLFLALFCACSNDDDDDTDTQTKYFFDIINLTGGGDIYISLENTNITCINKLVKDSSKTRIELTETQLINEKETNFKIIVYQPKTGVRDTSYSKPGMYEQNNEKVLFLNFEGTLN